MNLANYRFDKILTPSSVDAKNKQRRHSRLCGDLLVKVTQVIELISTTPNHQNGMNRTVCGCSFHRSINAASLMAGSRAAASTA